MTLPPSDPFWESYYPPNGWNCRCYVVPVDEKIIKANGLHISTGEGHIYWETGSRTGKKFAVYSDGDAVISCDPGWSYCVGKDSRLRYSEK